jgi:hypothetical protein
VLNNSVALPYYEDFEALNSLPSNFWIIENLGDDEASIKNNLISVNSPIARGLIGKQIDDSVIIETPKGNVEFEIIEVEYL